MTEDKKKNKVLNKFVDAKKNKVAVVKQKLSAIGIIQSMDILPSDLNHIIEIFKQTDIIIETGDKYELSKNGYYIYKTGGFTPNRFNKLQRWLNKDGNYWKIVNPIAGFIIGWVFFYVTH